MTDWLPGDPDPTRPAREPRRHRHSWRETQTMGDQSRVLEWVIVCRMCNVVRDEAASRRGRNNRKRGLTIQRESVRAAGGENIPGNGPYDGRSAMFRFESKSGGAFPERLWTYLRGIPVTTETPVLIVSDTPGPGHARRAVVIVDLDDWQALHGVDE